MSALQRFLAPALPLARVAWLRVVIYLYVVFDVLVVVRDPIAHGAVPVELYHPVIARELLGFPAPSPGYVQVLRAVLIASALIAATGRLPRLAGAVCAIAMSVTVAV